MWGFGGFALPPPTTAVYAAPMEDSWTRADNGATEAGHPAGRWMGVKQAAAILGTSSDAIRKRVSRSTIPSRKLPDGSVQVRLDGPDGDQPGGGTEAGRTSDESRRDEMAESLHEQVRYLREVLNEERDAQRRADTIIAQLTQANAFLARRVPELEPARDAREAHQAAAEAPGGVVEDREGEGGPQNGSQRRSWWRTWFGF